MTLQSLFLLIKICRDKFLLRSTAVLDLTDENKATDLTATTHLHSSFAGCRRSEAAIHFYFSLCFVKSQSDGGLVASCEMNCQIIHKILNSLEAFSSPIICCQIKMARASIRTQIIFQVTLQLILHLVPHFIRTSLHVFALQFITIIKSSCA